MLRRAGSIPVIRTIKQMETSVFLCYEDPKQKQHTFNIKKCSLEIHSSVQKRLPNKRSHTHMSIILYTCEIFLFCYKCY